MKISLEAKVKFNSNVNVLRNHATRDFSGEFYEGRQILNVAIVGGSVSDYEVAIIIEKFPTVVIKVYGIEQGQIFMDLNEPPNLQEKFDLVLCTNVLEHVFHHENFAKNLLSLLNQNSLLWLSFPFSDMYHGSPYYYSAGFDPDYVEKLFHIHGGVTMKKKIIASRRLYLFTHLLKDWPSEFRYKHPLAGQIIWGLGLRKNPRPPIKTLSPARLFICGYLSFTQSKFDSNPNNGCGVWMKIRKA
jgi:SAM-dependent methyltransferase